MDEDHPTDLARRWTHSHEEDRAGVQVFRTESWHFPPSRGRRSFDLDIGGDLVSAGPGPNDRTRTVSGKWRLLTGGILELRPSDGAVTRMKVLKLTGDRLEVSRQ